MYKKILFADDLCKRAEKPLKEAIILAKHYNAELYILNVREDFMNKDEMVMLRVDVSDFQDDIKKKAVGIKNKIELDVDEFGGEELKTEILLREGKPEQVICEVAEELNVDLIVLGKHGSSLLKDKVFGSTSHAVINHARRSVLTVWNGE
jgi:nucleotide-binding universal stress UspA family protein